jgi:HD-GYP domain-containing protein (c-di-GMP phosphodiesterase class II)/PAS domain-containing protein
MIQRHGSVVCSYSGLLHSLETLESHAQRVSAILDWTSEALHADGVALLEADAFPSAGLSAASSVGTLCAPASAIAAAWAAVGLPRKRALMALPAVIGGVDAVFACPLGVHEGATASVLLLHGADIEQSVRAGDADLLLASTLLRECVENERLRRQREGEKALSALLSGTSVPSRGLSGLALLSDGLGLPLYACDAQGRFLHASPAFLALTGYPSMEDLSQRGGLFFDEKARADELEMVRSLGKVASFPLSVRSGSGARLAVRDSLVGIEDSLFGVFIDVTALVSSNAELKDALQIQELLNDGILSGTKALQRTQGAAIRTLARLAEYRDPETGFHLQRICEYTRLLASQVHERTPFSFRITREYADDVSVSSMLHDIGKVSIPDSILLKPGPLGADEWDLMKKHTIFGWEVLHKADQDLGEQSFLTLAATIALSHHEKYDGTGYPHGTAGEQIPLSARISTMADVYDALTTKRPYKDAWSHERAVEEMVGQSGTHFDPVLIEIFRDVNERFAEVRRQFPG